MFLPGYDANLHLIGISEMALRNRASYKRYLTDSTHGVPRETKRRRRRLLDLNQPNFPAVCTTTDAAPTDDGRFHSDDIPNELSSHSLTTVTFSSNTYEILE